MKLPFSALVALAALSLACNLAIPGSNPESPNPTFAAPTAVPTATLTPEPTATPTPAPTATPPFDHSKSGSIESDITYCIVDGIELKMDVYYPQSTDGLWPVAVYVHGGSFTGGNKMRCAGIPFVQPLVDANYLVVSVNYRLAPEHPFPAPIEDVKCAIRSLRANASMYNIDVNHIGVFGGSAGGQLVSLLGVTDASAGMDGSGGYVEQSSRVQAAVSRAGPSDATLHCTSERVQIVFGVDNCPGYRNAFEVQPGELCKPGRPTFSAAAWCVRHIGSPDPFRGIL